MQPIRSVLIVGGGTSGWLSAAYLARKLGSVHENGVKVTLIEASDIPTVGVGEATIPPIRSMMASLGISEADFLHHTNGTFKLAVRFEGWRKPNSGGRAHSYYHAFGKYGLLGHEPLAPYWLLDRDEIDRSFVNYTMIEGPVLDAGCGPKRADDPDFGGPLDYAYHFDAGLLAQLLKKVALGAGVRHLVGKVGNANLNEDGSIRSIETDAHGELAADLYLDCTGFRAQLIEKTMGSPFVSASNTLFCDSAVACRVPYPSENTPLPPYTTATALDCGWCWHIPLFDRFGAGYVYSSRYLDADGAENELRSHLGEDQVKDIEFFRINMRVGRQKQAWVKNCIGIGLSGGFIEPLESTGIYLVDIGLRWLVDMFPTKETLATAAKGYNSRMEACYQDIFDFIKLHYCLNNREEKFWKDNVNPDTIPETLRRKLDMWQYRIPGQYEFGHLPNVFGLSNYIQVLYGLNEFPNLPNSDARYPLRAEARKVAEQIYRVGETGVRTLPSHRSLVEQLRARAA